MLTLNHQRVLEAARDAASPLGADDTHTVAAAAIDVSGRIHTGANVHHFTGGPCAELVVMGQAAVVSADRLLAITAVGDGGRGILAPCGRCRQILLDVHPDVVVLLSGDDHAHRSADRVDGVSAVPIRSLLPRQFRAPDRDAERVLHFAGQYYDDVASGLKTVTIRLDDPQRIGAVSMVFEDASVDGYRVLPGVVDSIEQRAFGELTAEDVRRENASSLEALRAGLRGHYPYITEEDRVDVVGFRLT